MNRGKALTVTLASLAVVAVILCALYAFIVWEGSSAREDAPALEAKIAQWLLHRTVPASFRVMKNPLNTAPGSPDVSAGHQVYRDKCELCHAYDGSGKTEIGSGEYPHPPGLRSAAVQKMSDGELFYHIKNGVRHTGMPAGQLPDRKVCQVSAYLRNLPKVAALSTPANEQPVASVASAHYVGSAACKACHTDIYERWKTTRMANVVRNPREHADAIIPDLSRPDPLLNFTRDDIAFTNGSKWKKRYFKQVGDDYFVFPAQWDIMHKIWRPYFVKNGTDWWAALYPPDNFQRPTGMGVIFEGPYEWVVRPVLELFAARDTGGSRTNSALVGLIWRSREKLSFDVGVRAARSNDQNIAEIRAGFTWTF